MRKLVCATALISIALLGAGCKKSLPVVGKWTGPLSTGGAANLSGQFEFKPDNTMAMTSKVPMPTGGQIDLSLTGDYKVDGDKLTMTLKDVQMKGAPKGTEDMFKSFMKGMLNKPETMTVKFEGDDSMALTSNEPTPTAGTAMSKGATTPPAAGKTINLTRVKEGA